MTLLTFTLRGFRVDDASWMFIPTLYIGWASGHRELGLVWGQWALVCKFG